MRRRTIRFRITAVASVAVAVVLLLGGLALLLLQRTTLTSSLDETLRQRADEIVRLTAREPALPEILPVGPAEGFAQLVDDHGEVVVATPNIVGAAALPTVSTTDEGDVFRTIAAPRIDDDVFRVLSRPLDGAGTLHVGASADLVSESTAALLVSMSVIVPVLVVAIAGVVWWLTGRTLQPVEDIRMEVAEISSSELHRRVPEPGSADEINRLAITMNEMLDRLEDAVDRQQRFVADASHELRSPLARLRSELEVELSEDLSPGIQLILEGLLEEVVGMSRIVDDLLYLARADAGEAQEAREPVDLDEIVFREVQQLKSHGKIDVDTSAVSAAQVLGDGGQLRRVVRNLLDNAERHTTSKVAITLAESAGEAVLVVTDDGPGIDPADIDRAFERFGRLDQARTSGKGGTGLGLAIAREIVEGHQGSITLTQGGPGAIFEVRIPTTA